MDDAKVEVVHDKQIATTSAHGKDMTIQSNSTRASKHTLKSINDVVRKRLLDSPMSEVEDENKPAKCSKNIKRKKSSTDVDNSKDNSEEEKEVFYLLVSNLPFEWTKDQVSEYIREHCVEVYAIEHFDGGDSDSGQSVRLSFLSFLKSNDARKQLKLKKPNGNKLTIKFYIPEESDSDSSSKETLLCEKWCAKTPSPSLPWQPDVDIWTPDVDGLYGLREEYLQSLGITPPLDKWIHVSNFRCDKSELKEVLELAGHVVLCNVITISKKYARVMYSHPLEAVQAVSMLNGQLYYGQVLKVSMYRCPDDEMILPKGLASIGPGLGMLGKPLRDVVREYERFLSGRHTTVNESVFIERCFSTNSNGKKQNADASEANSSITSPKTSEHCVNIAQQIKQRSHSANTYSNTSETDDGQSQNLDATTTKFNVTSPRKLRQKHNKHMVNTGPESAPVRTNSACSSLQFTNVPIINKSYQSVSGASTDCAGPQTLLPHQPVQRFVGAGGFPGNPLPRTTTPACLPRATVCPAFPNPGMSACVPTRVRGPQNPGQMVPNTACWDNISSFNSSAQTSIGGTTATVELRNLPLSTTFPLLTEKMAQVGQVISLELTRPGCAVVRFANSTQAQSCYQQYNKMCVMGNIIEVIFI